MENIDREQFKYFNDLDLPLLVLSTNHNYNFNNKKEWIKIAHQTAGIACHNHYFYGTIIEPKKYVKKVMKDISDYWYESNAGLFGSSLDEILIYRNQLNEKLDVDCNNSYKSFEEGLYPIDCTIENIQKLSRYNFTSDLDSLIKFDKKVDRFFGSINRFNLYIIGENSD